jgi:hypothetical protein
MTRIPITGTKIVLAGQVSPSTGRKVARSSKLEVFIFTLPLRPGVPFVRIYRKFRAHLIFVNPCLCFNIIIQPKPEMDAMSIKHRQSDQRKGDPYRDQRSGQDRRQVHLLSYFSNGGKENRSDRERRSSEERRNGCIRVTQWSSVCIETLPDRPDH